MGRIAQKLRKDRRAGYAEEDKKFHGNGNWEKPRRNWIPSGGAGGRGISDALYRKKYKIGPKPFVVLFLGRLASNKGLPYLFGGFKGIKTKDKKLLIVGKENPSFADTTFKYYASIARNLGVLEETIFTKEVGTR